MIGTCIERALTERDKGYEAGICFTRLLIFTALLISTALLIFTALLVFTKLLAYMGYE